MILRSIPNAVRDVEGKVEEGGLFKRTIKEYAEISVLHGMRYFGERGRPWSEKVWWSLATLISALGIAFPILDTWHQWTDSPVVMSFAGKPTSIWEIPFPTVTVCPSNKYRMNVVYSEDPDVNITEEVQKIIEGLNLVCRSMSGSGIQHHIEGDYPYFMDETTQRNLWHVAPQLSDTVHCSGSANVSSCSWMMDSLITAEGLCFTYNALPNGSIYRHRSTDKRPVWDLEKGYREDLGITELPVRATGAGLSRGVSLTLMINISELDYTCQQIQGFRIVLTNPADMPNTRDQYYFVPVSGLTQMAVTPQVTETEEALRDYYPHQRHCYYPSERQLAFYTTYTQDNCDLECLSNYTLILCKCVDYYMPRERTTPVCGLASAPCMHHAEMELQKNLMGGKKNKHSKISCDCLPSCKYITYSAEISQGNLELDRIKAVQVVDENKLRNISMNLLLIFMKHPEFLALRRRELYGITSFVANCGGLLGLCCGFSVLGFVELLYFFTLRMWNNTRKTREVLKPLPYPRHTQVLSWY